MAKKQLSSDFLEYLVENYQSETDCPQLPSLSELSKQLGVSISTLREQVEAARTLGLVEARPRTGTRRLPYSFLPAVRQSLSFAMAINPETFQQFADLRRKIETGYWYEAVGRLTLEDQVRLRSLVTRAWEKLRGSPVQIPHAEHREMHLTIYRRLDNPFVLGILEAYWDAYEAIGLSLYADYYYLEEVWGYHQRMVDAICSGDLEAGYNALLVHADLIRYRAVPNGDGVKLVTHP
jgi:DNA-binding FadR family transcriptional regulator